VIEERARAKVNLGLAVLGRRPDGYHELHTLFATLDLADRVRLARRKRGIALAVAGAELPTGEANLAYRAARAYLEATGVEAGVTIALEKRIPLAAGLGGGSADAAAVLRGMERLFGAGADLPALAAELGADVPFLLRGGLAEARGVGERLRPLLPTPLHLVLVNPGFPVPTAEVYRALGPGDWGPELEAGAILEALAENRPPPWRNDLEAAAFRLFPQLRALKEVLLGHGLEPLLAGSGPTFLAPLPDRERAEATARALAARYPGFWVRAARLEAPA